MAKGSILMVLLQVLSRSVGLIGTVIMARLLDPDDFGLVALAVMVTGIFQVVGQFGTGLALIHDQAAGRIEYDTAWTLQILKGVARGVALALAAPLVAEYFGDERLPPILLAFAVMFVVGGFQNIGTVDFRKHLRFGPLVRLRTYSKLGALAASVTVAVIWGTYWALIVGILTERGLSAAFSYSMQPYRPRFCLQAWRKVMHFSKWISFNNILAYLNGRADIFILGRFVGTDVLGHYSVAKRVSNLAASEVTMPATETLFPGFAKISHDVERLAALYLSSLSMLLFVGVPIAVGVLFLGDLIVRVTLGEKWLPSVPLLKILSIYGIIRSSVGSTSSVMLALGKPHLLTALATTRFAVMVPLVFWGVSTAGATGVAWAIVASAAVGLVLNSLVISRLLRFSAMRVISAVWRVVISAAVMSVVLFFAHALWPATEDIWLSLARLLALIVLGTATYVLSCAGFWALAGFPEGTERHAMSLVAHGLARISTRLPGRTPSASPRSSRRDASSSGGTDAG